MEAVDGRAGAEEEQRLEEGVGHHQEDGRLVGPASDGQEHVPELGHGRVGQHLLDVLLGAGDGGGHECGRGPDAGHREGGRRRGVEQWVDPAQEIDAGGHHGGGVDEGGHRGRALHGVGQPGEKRDLGRLAHHADEAAGRWR